LHNGTRSTSSHAKLYMTSFGRKNTVLQA
jgi:hypothetical protein